jgi:hypothetical protein
MRAIALSVIILSLFASCSKEINFDINKKPQKLVLNAILEPSSPASIHISLSAPINEGKIIRVNDATVIIFENSIPLDTLYSGKSGIYQFITIKPKPGFSYRFRVISKNHGTAEGETIVPPTPQIAIKEISKQLITVGPVGYTWLETVIGLKFELKDEPNKQNYYSFMPTIGRGNDTIIIKNYRFNPATNTWLDTIILQKCEKTIPTTTSNALIEYKNGEGSLGFDGTPTVQRVNRDLGAIEGNSQTIFGSMFWFTDRAIDGSTQSISLTMSSWEDDYCTIFDEQGIRRQPYSLYFCSMSESFYRYWVTANLQQEDIFAEPVTIYSNVTNGYGVIAARNVVRVMFFLRD